jgi:NADH dehydrogenase (ubiquinone) 1 alpha subcomplex subunit 13
MLIQSFCFEFGLVRKQESVRMASGFRQDMPPEGGYGTIDITRKGARRFISNRALLVAFLGVSAYGLYDVKGVLRRATERRREKDDTFIALEPFLAAENDRSFLKTLISNKEEEEKLMKNVPGWKTGTLFGEKFFRTVPSDHLDPVKLFVFYAHRPQDEMFDNVYPERTL